MQTISPSPRRRGRNTMRKTGMIAKPIYKVMCATTSVSSPRFAPSS